MQKDPIHKSIWQSFWNKWVLAYREFSFETTLSPEECNRRIQEMEHEALGCFNFAGCMKVTTYSYKIRGKYIFTIALIWREKRHSTKNIELQGNITSVNGKTYVAGTISEIPFVLLLLYFV
jgi:hypothetical protein